MMDIAKQKTKKAKLPRKRKKACIKEQGRKSYLDTIQLAKVTGESPCKFWVNSSLRPTPYAGGLIPMPTKYW